MNMVLVRWHDRKPWCRSETGRAGRPTLCSGRSGLWKLRKTQGLEGSSGLLCICTFKEVVVRWVELLAGRQMRKEEITDGLVNTSNP